MSTRSNLCFEMPDKKIKSIYVHSDGYPYGVGKILIDHYNDYAKAESLFHHGDASYLDSTIDECSFYSRDWDRDAKENQARIARDEWIYMRGMDGDVFIEYIYLFKNNRWHVSEMTSVKTPKGYQDTQFYFKKFELLEHNKQYIKYRDKHEKHAEVKMVSQIGNMLKKQFKTDNIVNQVGKMKKSN